VDKERREGASNRKTWIDEEEGDVLCVCMCSGTERESSNQTINSELYCEQLQRLQQAIERKRPELINKRGVVFHHNNARPHTTLMTRLKLRELGWEVLMHPYPDIADYHLFRSLQNSLNNNVKLASKEACENHLKQFFDQKSQKFAMPQIMPQKWQNIIENNGAYLV